MKPSFDPVIMEINVEDSMSTNQLKKRLNSPHVNAKNKTPRNESKKIILPQTSSNTARELSIVSKIQPEEQKLPIRLSRSTLEPQQDEIQVKSERNTSSNQVSNSFSASQQDDFNMRQLPANKYLSDSDSITD
jgi:hypothetical protein